MKSIQQAAAAYLARALGVTTAEERGKAAVYPLVTVSVREKGATVLCGGRQCEHTYLLTVRAADSRDREGACALLTEAAAALTAGVPYTDETGADRVLHPAALSAEGDGLTCTVTVCRLTPGQSGGDSPAGNMETLHLTVESRRGAGGAVPAPGR